MIPGVLGRFPCLPAVNSTHLARQTNQRSGLMNRRQEGLTITGCSSFTDAVVVPQLARACIRAASHHELYTESFSGLKKLRAVSKGVRSILQSLIEGYTITLGSEHDSDFEQQVHFLRTVNLRKLKVVIPLLASGNQRVRGTRLCVSNSTQKEKKALRHSLCQLLEFLHKYASHVAAKRFDPTRLLSVDHAFQ